MLSPLPATLGTDIASAIHAYGEPVVYRSQAGGADVPLIARVERPTDKALAGDAAQDDMVVFIAPADLPQRPVRFDRLVIAGAERTIETADPEGAGGVVLAWRCKLIGEDA
jgi:hypothetical protein